MCRCHPRSETSRTSQIRARMRCASGRTGKPLSQARIEREGLAVRVKDFEAEKTRLESERARLQRITAERLARMQTGGDDLGKPGDLVPGASQPCPNR